MNAWMDVGCQIVRLDDDLVIWMLDGCWMLDVGCWMLDFYHDDLVI